MSRGPDAATALRRALERDARSGGWAVTFGETQAKRWASATFVGARHRISLSAEAGCAPWLEGLPERDLPMRGQLLADLAVVAVRRDAERISAEIEALTVEV